LAGSSYTELQAETKISKTCNEYYKRWTNEAEWDLQACFKCTDWSVFEAAAIDLDDLIETVKSYSTSVSVRICASLPGLV